jgi:hypothetical protein
MAAMLQDRRQVAHGHAVAQQLPQHTLDLAEAQRLRHQLLDQLRLRLRDTVHHLFRLLGREQVGQEVADDLRQRAGEGRGWIDACVAGSRRAIALLSRNPNCAGPNAGSRVAVPSRLDAAVPGMIARRRSG